LVSKWAFAGAVDGFCKLLKINIFILQKLLDTLLLRLIRFRQKVLTALPPLELFSLKEKAAFCRAVFSFLEDGRGLRDNSRLSFPGP
jgi:hypothetical protein